MADGSGGGGNTGMALILGILIAVVAIGGFFMYNGGHFGGGDTHTLNLNVKAPSKPGG
ncbi:MAG TPA: hypothetical protein VHE09_00745 [Rhizomicrobium sp.]|nr:hypothetical protein [Rhizomicrobium sp.]